MSLKQAYRALPEFHTPGAARSMNDEWSIWFTFVAKWFQNLQHTMVGYWE